MMNRPEDEKQRVIDSQTLHLKNATSARMHMNDCIAECRNSVGHLATPAVLGPHAPLSGPGVGHYCFDFAQQVRQALVFR